MASRSSGGGTVLASGIRTREKKERKLYSDDWATGDDEIEGRHTFDLNEKVTSDKFDINFVKDMADVEFNLAYLQKHGFNWPLLFKEKQKLGIVIPDETFTINDVRLGVGSRRMLDVMDVNTQKNVEMTMKDWQRYYESQDKDKLLNVISLEFSHTKLEHMIEAPTVVRQIDWVENVWPRHLKEAQTQSTNVLEDMMYPKVQKYCLMSVSGCYTDFHIDFGGTSVWYHILKGRKIFWLIPPSERNLQLYEQWVLSGKQSDIFFGDTVEKCARVQLEAGNTFFIPTGWIHAVYTPDDSLVFGGNFLHSFGIEKQLRIANVEDATRVPQKFRYPFFTEMLWYLLERYVHILLGKTHLCLPDDEQQTYEKSPFYQNLNNNKEEHIHLTPYELHGLKAIVLFLHSLPPSKKSVPELIKYPIALIQDVRVVVEQHRYDNADQAVTNNPIMMWWEREPVRFTVKRSLSDVGSQMKKRRQSADDHKSFSKPPNAAVQRHRRVRCKECEPCTRGDCRECSFCKDMTRYGGPGTMKQTCKFKKCSMPALAVGALCYLCKLDGWDRVQCQPQKPIPGVSSNLMECLVCYKIYHVKCIGPQYPEHEGIVNEDVPNSWECPECVSLGYNKDYKQNRFPSSRVSSIGSDSNVKSPPELSESEDVDRKPKVEEPLSEGSQMVTTESKPELNGTIQTEKNNVSDPTPPKMPTWQQLQDRVSYNLVRPTWVIRPAPLVQEDEEEEDSGSDSEAKRPSPVHPTMMKKIMLKVFKHLNKADLLSAMQVCRQWASWSIDPSLWKEISLVHRTIDANHLTGVVRRQPDVLNLDWTRMTHKQLTWLIPRIPQLSSLSVEGLSFEILRALVSSYCPVLTKLNMSFCEGITDDTLGFLLRPPPFNRPGHRDTSSRLRQLTHLKLAGTRIGEAGIGVIVRSLPFLTHLDLNSCPRVTNDAVELLASPTSIVSHSLKSLDLRWCNQLTPLSLPSLASLPLVSHLGLDPCKFIPFKAIKVWGKTHGYSFGEENIMSRPARKLSTEDPPSDSETAPSVECSSRPIKEELVSGNETDETAKEKPDAQVTTPSKKEKTPVVQKRKKRKLSDSKAIKKEKDSGDSKDEEQTTNEGSESCRRSERSTKGSSASTTKSPRKGKDKQSATDGNSGFGDKSEESKKSSSGQVPRKKKKIMTRSKIVKPSEEADLNVSKSSNKDAFKGEVSVSLEDTLKHKSGSSKASGSSRKYSSKLRKKSQDDVETSPEDNLKKKTKDFSSPTSLKRTRKSSTSSSSCSPIILPPTKKLKIELEPIGKLARRRSDGHHKPTTSSTPSTPSEKTSPSNRERPERQHRSPRRLSMCQ